MKIGKDAASEQGLHIQLMGGFEARIDGKPLPHLRSRKVQWLLALLILRHEQAMDRAWLAGTLWPDSAPSQALYNLRQSLSNLRHALGAASSCLRIAQGSALGMDFTNVSVDVLAFDAAVAAGNSAFCEIQTQDAASPVAADADSANDGRDATIFWERAAALYRGPLLAGCMEEWVFKERDIRQENFLLALERLADSALTHGNESAAVTYLRTAVQTDPFRERTQRALIYALACAGDYGAAVQVYRELRLLLRRELNADPDPETVTLFAHVQQHARQALSEPSSLRHKLPSASSHILPGRTTANEARPMPAEAPPTLPCPLTALVGRTQEVAQATALLKQTRLLTLSGPGGIGKTRLAIAVAEQAGEAFPHGVCFVDLAPLSNSDLLAQTVATALPAREQAGHSPMTALQEHLYSKTLLLLLDNCEHLLSSCSSFADTLLRQCPKLKILATSRQALGLSGEVVWSVPPLSVPSLDERGETQADRKTFTAEMEAFDALRLFEERAREACPGFTLHAHNRDMVARICQRLDGIPLAIELAAARTRSLSLDDIILRLRTNFRLLKGGAKTLPRQETLAAAFAWSWDLLNREEGLLLERLSVFTSGWTLPAAEAICGGEGLEPTEVIDLLLTLVDRSLVVYVPPRASTNHTAHAPSEARYHLLETTRQFASERLAARDEAARLRDRHRDHFLTWAESIRSKLWGEEQALWFERLEREHHNLRAALEWCREQDAREQEFRCVIAFSRFWDTHGHLCEGYAQLQATLARVTPELPIMLHVDALVNAGWMAHVLNANAASRAHCEQALALCRQIGYEYHLPGLLIFLACGYSDEGHYAKARALFDDANSLCLRLNQPGRQAAALTNLGRCLLQQGELAEAQTYLEEGAKLCKAAGKLQLLGVALHNLALVALKQENDSSAFTYSIASLRAYHAGHNLVNLPEALDMMAVLAQRGAQWERAACLLGITEGLRRSLGVPLEDTISPYLGEAATATQATLGADTFAALYATGATMTVEDAVVYTLPADQPSSYKGDINP